MFLTPAELVTLTGYERPTAQRAELDRLGVRYVINSRGHLVVLWSAVEAALGQPKQAPGPAEQPDYGALA